jgi:Amt family ammonium transporter
MVTTGSLIILITGLILNGGIGGILESEKNSPNAIVMNTVISSAISGLTHMVSDILRNFRYQEQQMQETGLVRNYHIQELCNAVIAGFVSIKACCDNVELWQSCLIGLIASFIYSSTKKVLVRFEIDDPLDTTQVHGFCGFWAILACGIFDKDRGFLTTGDSKFVVIQLVGAMSIFIWAMLLSFVFFSTLK